MITLKIKKLVSCEQWWINFIEYHVNFYSENHPKSWNGYHTVNELLLEYNAVADRENDTITFETEEQASFFLLRWS